MSANSLNTVNLRIPSKFRIFRLASPPSKWRRACQHILKITLKNKIHSRTGLEIAVGDPTTSLAVGVETAKNEELKLASRTDEMDPDMKLRPT